MSETEPSKTALEAMKIMVSHADRLWKSEEVNATRLFSKANLVCGGVTAILGFKLFTTGRALDYVIVAPIWLQAVFCSLSAFSILVLFAALKQAIDLKFGRENPEPTDADDRADQESDVKPPTASGRLMPPDWILEELEQLSDVQAACLSYRLTLRAAGDLQKRNEERKTQIENAEVCLLLGLVSVVLAGIVYVVAWWFFPLKGH